MASRGRMGELMACWVRKRTVHAEMREGRRRISPVAAPPRKTVRSVSEYVSPAVREAESVPIMKVPAIRRPAR